MPVNWLGVAKRIDHYKQQRNIIFLKKTLLQPQQIRFNLNFYKSKKSEFHSVGLKAVPKRTKKKKKGKDVTKKGEK